MQVTKVSQNSPKAYEAGAYQQKEAVKQEEMKKTGQGQAAGELAPFSKWQKDILLGAIDKLENSKQLDNSHPLGQEGSQPIESYEEALIELSFIKSPFFGQYASEAQANIPAETYLELISEEE